MVGFFLLALCSISEALAAHMGHEKLRKLFKNRSWALTLVIISIAYPFSVLFYAFSDNFVIFFPAWLLLGISALSVLLRMLQIKPKIFNRVDSYLSSVLLGMMAYFKARIFMGHF